MAFYEVKNVYKSFGDNRVLKGIDFDLEEVVRFEGDTGPYVQYTNARAQSILRKANKEISMDNLSLNDDWSFAVAKALADFPAIVEKASEKFEPSIIAKYALDLSKKFNKYYANVRILDEERNEREICKFNLKENGSTVTSVIFAELYKINGEWQFKAIGEGKIADLNGILGLYM